MRGKGKTATPLFRKRISLSEIRKGLVDQAMQDRSKLEYQENVYYLHAEFDEEFVIEQLKHYPGTIEIFCCQMPDPRFEKNMRRRGRKKLTMQRIIRKSLVAALGTVLDPVKGIMYISSEYEEVMLQMRDASLIIVTAFEWQQWRNKALYFGQSTKYDKVSEKKLVSK